jgi:hypothetical protein
LFVTVAVAVAAVDAVTSLAMAQAPQIVLLRSTARATVGRQVLPQLIIESANALSSRVHADSPGVSVRIAGAVRRAPNERFGMLTIRPAMLRV